MWQVAEVDSNIFYSWDLSFVDEIKYRRRNGDKILLIIDEYSCHINYNTLELLRDSEIIVAGLPVHTREVLQTLNVPVFAPRKAEFKD